jgi:hypothetical protein
VTRASSAITTPLANAVSGAIQLASARKPPGRDAVVDEAASDPGRQGQLG